MKSKYKFPLLLIPMILVMVACQSAVQSKISSSNGLPLPKSVADAALANFRRITDTGRSIGAVWSPDGQNLAYTELSIAPSLVSYRSSNAQPKTEVWVATANGKDEHMLDMGIPLFYSKDGTEIYYQIYDPSENTPSVYAINPATKKTRHFLGTQGFPNVNSLADGRLVLSEVGTYAPLYVFNPSDGERVTYMVEHPSSAPQDARLSPDGKLLAYPQFQALFLSKPDGSSSKLLSDQGSGPVKIWWSPDSRYLVYSTGETQIDKLVLTDRQGKIKTFLYPLYADNGYASSVVWSPDSRWMVVSMEAITQYAYPTRIYLFDKDGNNKLLLESYISASPEWSPDGHTLAFSLWIEPQSDEPVFDIWLADLTDTKTAAPLPPSVPPAPKPEPTLAAIPPDMPPDQVILLFWERINQKDYHAAWSMLSETGRFAQKYPEFKAFYECMQQVSTSGIQEVQGDEDTKVFSLIIDYQRDPDCNDLWQQPNDKYTILIKEQTAAPWQIECFNNAPSCINQGP